MAPGTLPLDFVAICLPTRVTHTSPSPTPAAPCRFICSYEEASPKVKQRLSAARTAAAPWRAIMRDENDEMIFSMRGLPEKVGLACCLAPGQLQPPQQCTRLLACPCVMLPPHR